MTGITTNNEEGLAMRVFVILFVCLLVCAVAGPAAAICVEDQYGNQTTLSLDNQHGLLIGTADVTLSGCQTSFYYALGSFWRSNGQILYEVSFVNPLGDGDAFCVNGYKNYGTYPNSAWAYFDSGYGAQTFRWKKCGTAQKNGFMTAPLPGTGLLK